MHGNDVRQGGIKIEVTYRLIRAGASAMDDCAQTLDPFSLVEKIYIAMETEAALSLQSSAHQSPLSLRVLRTLVRLLC